MHDSALSLTASLLLYGAIGAAFVAAHLLIGRAFRPHHPTPDKNAVYECGEPAVGTSFVQFDLRFYVIALVFLILEVEVAFFFPWAVVAGRAAELSELSRSATIHESLREQDRHLDLMTRRWDDLAVAGSARQVSERSGDHARPRPQMPTSDNARTDDPSQMVTQAHGKAQSLLRIALVDMGIFFAVLLLGFAYVWRRGDLDWIRSYQRSRTAARLALPVAADGTVADLDEIPQAHGRVR